MAKDWRYWIKFNTSIAKSAITDKKQRINLYLKTHILEDKDKLIKWEFCDAPITSNMIPEDEFDKIFSHREDGDLEEAKDEDDVIISNYNI